MENDPHVGRREGQSGRAELEKNDAMIESEATLQALIAPFRKGRLTNTSAHGSAAGGGGAPVVQQLCTPTTFSSPRPRTGDPELPCIVFAT